MTIEAGATVRTLVELLADDGSLLPKGTTATVIGYAGDRLVLEVMDWESDTKLGVECEAWDLLRVRGAA